MKCINQPVLLFGFILFSTLLPAQPWPDVDAAIEARVDGGAWGPVSPGLLNVTGSFAEFRGVLTPAGGSGAVYTNIVSHSFPTGNGSVQISLNRSNDLSSWSAINPGPEPVDPTVFIRVEADAAMSLVPAGAFTMGSPESEPERFDDEAQREVTLNRSFYIQQTEVTKAQWDAAVAQGPGLGYTDLVVGRNGYIGDASGNHPVTEVSWNNAVKWLNLLSELHGLTPCYTVGGEVHRTGLTTPECNFVANGYRLPTEAEWEYACRAGTTTAFHSGDMTEPFSSPVDPNLDLIGWYRGNESENTHPVGEKQPNAWGLFDMSGNVLEWCWDYYLADYDGVTDPTGPTTGTDRILRGGNFFNLAHQCRSAFRNLLEPDFGAYSVGFRPVRTVVP